MVVIAMVDKLLQTTELSYMRVEAKKAMPDTVNIQRKTTTSDQQGGYTESWDDAYQNIPARVTITGGGEVALQGRQEPRPDALLTVAFDQSIEQTDRVVHSSGTYEIKFVNTNRSWALVTQCQMRRL